jgi:hypothetical protein
MPYYDDPSGETRYDLPFVRYDDPSTTVESIKNMSQVVAGISGKTDAQVVEICTTIHTSLTDNAYVLAPNPALPAYLILINAASAAIDDFNAAKTLLAAKKEVRDNAMAALKAATMTQASTVQTATGGDKAQILTTGFKVKSVASPIGVPAQVSDLKVKPSDNDGALKVSWKPVRGAMSYEIQSSPDPIGTWTHKESTTTTRGVEVNSFTSGQKIWIRVRAIGAEGDGAWSDPSVKVVP